MYLFLFFIVLVAAGCENGCSRHGQCTLENGEYRCDCIEGWAGSDCSLALETNCKDNIDNDGGISYRINLPIYTHTHAHTRTHTH